MSDTREPDAKEDSFLRQQAMDYFTSVVGFSDSEAISAIGFG